MGILLNKLLQWVYTLSNAALKRPANELTHLMRTGHIHAISLLGDRLAEREAKLICEVKLSLCIAN
jgi:hypothetical protein